MGTAWSGSNGGMDWELELADHPLLPSRLAAGRVTVRAHHDVRSRGLVVTLRGEERWRHVVSNGKTSTVVTSTEAQPPVRVVVAQDVALLAGDTRRFDFELPVPPLGPASLEGTEAAMAWTLEAKLDLPNWPDPALEVDVRVAQPTALLRAGVVHVGEFALYEAAGAEGGGVTGSVELRPMPLVAGEPFSGRLVVDPQRAVDVDEIRVEVRVHVASTVSGGRSEEVTPFAAVVAGAGRLDGPRTIRFDGVLDGRALPTITLPHGRAEASVHVILARRHAMDPHLVRDVTIATTSKL